jgi:hypothetical protein
MNPATVTGLAAILGSIVGALGSSIRTWIIQRHQDRREVVRNIIDTYAQPNLTPEQIQFRATNGGDDPLRSFSEVCRGELDSMQELI